MINYKLLCGELDASHIKALANYRLCDYTSFRIGGDALLAVFPKNTDELVSALNILRSASCRFIVLGNATNVLFDDAGYDGAVIILDEMKHFGGIQDSVDTTDIGEDDFIITADAGYSLTRLASEAAALSLTGLEFAYGIPGSVGGGIFMNAGAYGGELSNVVWRSRWYDADTGELGCFVGSEHDFSYRHSAYMDSNRVILSADFRLRRGNKDEIRAAMDDYMSRRREKQPLEFPSAGSVFKRGNGFITAKLIEEAGLKGCTVGGAQVSEKHAGFIVNRGGATASDVLCLIEHIKKTVNSRFGVDIECEVRYIPRG